MCSRAFDAHRIQEKRILSQQKCWACVQTAKCKNIQQKTFLWESEREKTGKNAFNADVKCDEKKRNTNCRCECEKKANHKWNSSKQSEHWAKAFNE